MNEMDYFIPESHHYDSDEDYEGYCDGEDARNNDPDWDYDSDEEDYDLNPGISYNDAGEPRGYM